MLQFHHLKKEYSTKTILAIDDLVLSKGITLLQGENGSGKTTLLKMIVGLLPFDGVITIDNSFSLKKQRQQFIQRVNYAEKEKVQCN